MADHADRRSRLDDERWLIHIVFFLIATTIAVLGLVAATLLLLASAGTDPPAV